MHAGSATFDRRPRQLPKGVVLHDAMSDWFLHYLSADPDPLYVYIRAPGIEPVAFPVAGLGPELRKKLQLLMPGERVPRDVMDALLALGPRSEPPIVT